MRLAGQFVRSDSTSPRMRATECSPVRERGVHSTTIITARETGDRASAVRSRGLGCLFDAETHSYAPLHCGLHDSVRFRGLAERFQAERATDIFLS